MPSEGRAELDEAEMVEALRESGYLVVKIPPCSKQGGHGRHELVTKTVMCEGAEPIPHGYHSSFHTALGVRVNCRCGRSFSDATDRPTPWDEHMEEHGV